MRRVIATTATIALAVLTTFEAATTHPAVAKDRDDYNGAYSCINPAGHVRGRCRHTAHGAAMSGRVLSVGGVLVQFARKSGGGVITLNEQPLLAAGAPLIPGRYYSLQGYWTNGLFYATAIRSWAY